MRSDILDSRAKPGETQRRVLALLKESDEHMTVRDVSVAMGHDVRRVLLALERGGFISSYADLKESPAKWEHSTERLYAWLMDMPPATPMSEHRRAYFRQYRAKAKAVRDKLANASSPSA